MDRKSKSVNVVHLKLAAAVVIYKDRVLIVRRSNNENFKPGVWGVPCGKIDGRENPTKAVLRELHEETGLNGRVLQFVGTRKFKSYWRGQRAENVQRNYLVSPEVNRDAVGENDMPRVDTPEIDQESMWIPVSQIEQVEGLDEHNLATIRQGAQASRADRDDNSSAAVSSFRR